MSIEAMKLAFEKVTGIPDAWVNPALMQARNGFIQGWEALAEQRVLRARREWVGLTDEEKGWCAAPTYEETIERVEAKLKEKNT